jgi:excisionase family DNA binding protein
MGIDRERYLTVEEAAIRSKYTYEHIRRLVKTGSIAILEIAPRKYLIDWEDLQRYMMEKPQRKPHRDKKI